MGKVPLAHDIARYIEVAKITGGEILELCCGTGRVSIPLLKEGFHITGVDISATLLSRFHKNLEQFDSSLKNQLNLVEQDITELQIENKNHQLAICAFNSLLCITDFNLQLKALKNICDHLTDEGLLLLDLINPLALNFKGDSSPKAFFTRKNIHNGNTYTRFALVDAFDKHQRQRLHGWYDEIDSNGSVTRKPYSLHWRPIFRFEIELMLKDAGFYIEKIEGGHLKEEFTGQSSKMFIHARKRL